MIYESEEGLIEQTVPPKGKFLLFTLLAFGLLVIFLIYHLFFGPFGFKIQPDPKIGGVPFEVKDGMGAKQIGSALKDAGIISSKSLFTALASIFGDEKKIVAGVYLFSRPVGVVEAESRIAHGKFGLEAVKITFPEGFTVKQIADRLEARLPLFNRTEFWNIASSSEGYLFPETYFFSLGEDERKIFDTLVLMFRQQTKEIFSSFPKNKEEIVIMASILEKEVKNQEDMKIVSGIFWKRIKIGMALQADSTLDYERNKTSAELTAEDLKQDSPYNTYTRKGLPPAPINNPGLNAITAALNPTSSTYLYFLTDKDGKVYYAKTFEEHKANKAKYL